MISSTRVLATSCLPVSCLSVILAFGSPALSQSEAEVARYDELVALYQSATIVGEPSLEDCTLSDGAEAHCFKVTVVAAPSDHITGPFCPRNITDTAEEGGTWFIDGEVRDVDGEFIANLDEIFDDEGWQMYDPETGDINLLSGEIGCLGAGSPDNTEEQPTNTCVECTLGFMGGTVTQTYFIPLTPTEAAQQGGRIGPQSGIGLALNGVKLDAPAPLDLIYEGYTLGPFDDCAGHINPHAGYHYHGVREGCGAREPAKEEGHSAMLGVAMDGYDIYDRADGEGTVPEDLDTCGGHETEGLGYHYHANDTAENQIIGCFAAQTGCSSDDADGTCDASALQQQRPPPRE